MNLFEPSALLVEFGQSAVPSVWPDLSLPTQELLVIHVARAGLTCVSMRLDPRTSAGECVYAKYKHVITWGTSTSRQMQKLVANSLAGWLAGWLGQINTAYHKPKSYTASRKTNRLRYRRRDGGRVGGRHRLGRR